MSPFTHPPPLKIPIIFYIILLLQGKHMHIISKSTIDKFIQQYPTTKSSLYTWYKIIKKTNFSNFNELRATFPSADIVKNKQGQNLIVFNIGGNNIRLIAAIHFNHNKLYIRNILTHTEYSKNKWKN